MVMGLWGGQVMDQMVRERVGDADLSAPSISYRQTNLYMRGPLEEETKPNLSKVCLTRVKNGSRQL